MSSLACAAPFGGGTTFGFEAQGRDPYFQETGQQHAVEDDTHCGVHRMGAHRWTDCRRRWAICNMLRYAMCLDAQCTRVQTAGGSEDKRHSEWECSQHKDGTDFGVQVIGIARRFGDWTRNGVGIIVQRHRGALGRASPAILDGLSQSTGSGELPRVVAG